MIAWIAGLFGGSKLAAWALVAALGLGTLGGAYAWVDHGGYARAEAAWTIKYHEREIELQKQLFIEIEHQAIANDAAKAREAEKLAAEQKRRAELEAALLLAEQEADEDPGRDRIGIGADSVSRLNRIR